MTLPLIYVLNTCTKEERDWLIKSVKKYHDDKKRVKEIIAFVKEKGGIEYATKKMKEYQSEALELLETYPQSPYKDSLLTMVNYVIERKI
jgi:octaprenyl-diphosphate synthase